MIEILQNKQILIFSVLSLCLSIFWILKYFLKLFIEKKEAKSQVGYVMQIIPPKYQPEDFQNKQGERFSLQRFIDNLTASVKDSRISFEIYSDTNGIRFLVWTPTKKMQNLVKLNLYSTYKNRIKIKSLENDPVMNFKKDNSILNEYKAKKHHVYMLMDVRDFESMDPINDILTAMTGREGDSKVLFQLVLKPSTIDKEALKLAKENFRLVRNEISWFTVFLSHFEVYILYTVPLLPIILIKLLSAISKSFRQNNTGDPLSLLPDGDPRKIFVDKDDLQTFNSRMDEKYKTSFISYIRVMISEHSHEQTLNAIEQSLESMKSETQNRLIRKKSNRIQDCLNRFIYPEDKLFPFYTEIFTAQGELSSREISMLYHLPNRIFDPAIDHFVSPNIPVSKKYKTKRDNDDLGLGINNAREKEYTVYLPAENRKRHIVITGQTGTGKSTILKRFILQDIDNAITKGVNRGSILLDPHEDFFLEILQRVHQNSFNSNKLLAWDTRSEKYYFGFNPLYAVGLSERQIDLIVDSNYKLIEKIIKRANPESGMGMTGKPMLINGMKTIMVFQNEWIKRYGATEDSIKTMKRYAPTLIDVRTIFFETDLRKVVVDTFNLDKYEDLRSFWSGTLPNYEESKNWSEIRQGFDNRLSQILTGILMYTFGQSQNAINIEKIIRNSKTLLVNLSSKNIGEEGMSLLGSLLMSKVWFESKRITQNERKPFTVYADEFQNFASSDFAQALSEARKFKLELILAHQFFQQLPDDVFHSVMGNVKNKIYYRCGLEDAPIISKELQEKVLEQEVMEIPEFHANVKAGSDVFSIYIPQEREAISSMEKVNKFISDSYIKYGKSKKKIEKEIKERHDWIRDGCKVIKK